MPHAQLCGCPEASGLGRFRHSCAVIARARSPYSEFRQTVANGIDQADIVSFVRTIVFGTKFRRSGSVIKAALACVLLGPAMSVRPRSS